ncbi:K(+)-transporting ATPase subunit F [Gemmata sp. G18]|uniref:K(+)-transporting ATPase subunit F n=1 Tax=Gemmata palustris TaxID=2822762 RepID=A0ABS5BPA9_9BACT|nr:K(+)-transporting ATPase subunit F [Gemmata palustris]MBP3955287.1 K(+)-transporting ATPase subunit F [Gemmata palustris]
MRRTAVIWITVAVTLFLFVYLLAALLRPERF